MLRKKDNIKGFTLIELLVSIGILALILSIGLAIGINIKKKADEKIYNQSIESIYKAANLYYQESKLEPVPVSDTNYNYYCMTVRQLVNSGHFKDKDIANLKKINDSSKVTQNSYIKITEDKKLLSVTNIELVELDDNSSVCMNTISIKDIKEWANAIVYHINKTSLQNIKCKLGDQEKDISGDECVFDKLNPDSNYNIEVCSNTGSSSICESRSAKTDKLKMPTIKDIGYYLKQNLVSVTSFDNNWTNDKVFSLSCDLSNIYNNAGKCMIYVDGVNSLKPLSYGLYKCNNTACSLTKVNKDELNNNIGWYYIDNNDNKFEAKFQANKNVDIKAKISLFNDDGKIVNNSDENEKRLDNIDNEKPSLEVNVGKKSGSKTKVTLDYDDVGSGVKKYCQRENSSRPGYNNSCWEDIITSKNLADGTYYFWVMDGAFNRSDRVKVVIESSSSSSGKTYCVGGETFHNCILSGNRYECSEGKFSKTESYKEGECKSSGGSSSCSKDCKNVCLMTKNSEDWNFNTNNKSEQTRKHAMNSIIAGNLSFKDSITYNSVKGTWYKGNKLLYDWYESSCPKNCCSSGTNWSDYSNNRYNPKEIASKYGKCTDFNETYVSGYCGGGACVCCPIGYGYYNTDCYK